MTRKNCMTNVIEEFQELKVVAEQLKSKTKTVWLNIRSNHYLINYLEEITKFYINDYSKDTKYIIIDFAIITMAITTYEALFKKKWAKVLARAKSFNNNSGGHSYNNKKKIYEKKKVFGFFSNEEGYKKLLCRYHPGLNNHLEKNRLLSLDRKSRINKAACKKFEPNVRIRRKCKQTLNFKPEHKCKQEEDLQKIGKKV